MLRPVRWTFAVCVSVNAQYQMVEARTNVERYHIGDVLYWIMTQIATYKAFDTWRNLSLVHRDRLGHEWKHSCNM